MMHGVEANQQNAPGLTQMVERLARNANLPMPKVYVCPQNAPNAFATGRSPSKADMAAARLDWAMIRLVLPLWPASPLRSIPFPAEFR